MKVDNELKMRVLDLLMNDARLSHREIAAKLEISPTTAGKVIKGLEDEGIIQAYTIMVDWEKMGFDSVMCLQMATSPGADIEEVGSILKELGPIKQVFYTMGDTTFSCYAVCRDNPEAAKLIDEIGKVKGVEKLVCHTVLRAF